MTINNALGTSTFRLLSSKSLHVKSKISPLQIDKVKEWTTCLDGKIHYHLEVRNHTDKKSKKWLTALVISVLFSAVLLALVAGNFDKLATNPFKQAGLILGSVVTCIVLNGFTYYKKRKWQVETHKHQESLRLCNLCKNQIILPEFQTWAKERNIIQNPLSFEHLCLWADLYRKSVLLS